MTKKYWKRFSIYEGATAIFFCFNIVFYIANKDFLNAFLPLDITGYFFWLSMGLFLGFQLCKYEFKRVWRNMKEDEQKEETHKSQQYNPN